MRMRIFVLAEQIPQPDTAAGDLRFLHLLKLMARRHSVDLCVIDQAPMPTKDLLRYRRLIKGIGVRLLPYTRTDLSAALARTYYDIGFFEVFCVAQAYGDEFRYWQPGAKVIVDSVDVSFARSAAGVAVGVVDPAFAELEYQLEVPTYRAADAVVVISDHDEKVLTQEGGMPPLYTLPIIMPSRPRAPGERRCETLFIGGFKHEPNLDGLRWFMSDVWPAVHAALPEARLTIIGSHAPPEVWAYQQIPGINVLGFVPDTHPYLDQAAVSIAPLRYGAGMKGKVAEAMASGLPVVTTSIGAQGFRAVHGKHLLIADAPADFAQGLIDLLRDPQYAERLGRAGQQHVAALCGPEAVGRALEQMFRGVHPHPRPVLPLLDWCARAVTFHSPPWLRPLLETVGDMYFRLRARTGWAVQGSKNR
jgi:glycosyltransferase involved in cell wall biosynthesis